MKKWIAFWNILKKDMRNYYLKPPNISWGIIFPFAWGLMFLLRSNTEYDIRGILPGIIAVSILFGTTSMLAVTITFERRGRSFERLLIAPIDINLLMMAKTAGAIIFGILNAFVPVVFSLFFIDLSGINWPQMMSSVVLTAVTSTFLGLFIAVSVSEVFEAQTFSNFFRFPMMFLCGLFIPLDRLPAVLRPLSYILPLTYGVDVLKTAINDQGLLPVWCSLIILMLFAFVMFFFSIRNVKKKWIL
jgi:ABC-2 type transport system permease protein